MNRKNSCITKCFPRPCCCHADYIQVWPGRRYCPVESLDRSRLGFAPNCKSHARHQAIAEQLGSMIEGTDRQWHLCGHRTRGYFHALLLEVCLSMPRHTRWDALVLLACQGRSITCWHFLIFGLRRRQLLLPLTLPLQPPMLLRPQAFITRFIFHNDDDFPAPATLQPTSHWSKPRQGGWLP